MIKISNGLSGHEDWRSWNCWIGQSNWRTWTQVVCSSDEQGLEYYSESAVCFLSNQEFNDVAML